MPNGLSFAEDNVDGPGKRRPNPNLANGIPNGQSSESGDVPDVAAEELNAVRAREITSKAVSGSLLMLLKWFRISRKLSSSLFFFFGAQTSDLLSDVLKFEYLTQLLLDANYIPLILKFFNQDIDRAVEQRNDREDLE